MALDISIEVEAGEWPAPEHLDALARRAVLAALAHEGAGDAGSELGILFTDDAAVRALNARWRGKDKATNVLSFPAFADWRGEGLPPMLGDIVLAAETVSGEAEAEEKPFDNHISHLIVHGLLHLLGHDHEDDAQAEEMETAEREILATLAIPDPYA